MSPSKKISKTKQKIKTKRKKTKQPKSSGKSQKNHFLKSLTYFFTILLIIFGITVVAIFGLALAFNTKFYPKTRVAGVEVASLSPEDAYKKVNQAVLEYQKKDLLVACGAKEKKIKIKDLKPVFQIEDTLRKLFTLGHPQSFKEIIIQIPDIVRLLLFRQNMPLIVEIKNTDKISEINQVISTLPKPAEFKIVNDKLEIKSEENGTGVQEQELNDEILNSLSLLKTNLIFSPKPLRPAITGEILTEIKPKIEEILSHSPLKLLYEDQVKYELSKEDLVALIDFKAVNPLETIAFAIKQSGEDEVYTKIKSQVDQKGQNIKLQLRDGSVEVLEKEQSGLYLNEDDLTQKLITYFNNPKNNEIKLSLIRKLPAVNSANYKNFKFTDLLGEGDSYFYGSPSNRVSNINVGANKVHGTVIAKDEIFSLGETLGEISGEAGYVEGLVIKNNKTVAELGGGLCQVATTIFRAGLYSNLPVLERYPHGYRVPYYEPPAGMDAAIYYPDVDVKFKNDTPGPILIQSWVEGYHIVFSIYGQSDGRTHVITEPQLFNFVAPPAPNYIDDPSLPEGTEIVQEGEHWGADAFFSYKVYRGGKIIFEKDFPSHYSAWPATIRRGPQPAKQEEKK